MRFQNKASGHISYDLYLVADVVFWIPGEETNYFVQFVEFDWAFFVCDKFRFTTETLYLLSHKPVWAAHIVSCTQIKSNQSIYNFTL